MIRSLLVLSTLLAATASAAFAGEELRYLEETSRQYLASQPELRTYEVRVETSKLQEMLQSMTANMPSDLPRPETPVLKKYWSRAAGRSTIRMETDQPFPYMAKMVRRFSDRYNIDLKTFFLPPEGGKARKSLLERATVTHFENRVEEARNLHISLEFTEPTDLGGAFFREGLRLPQNDILAMALDIDPEKKLLHRLEITTGAAGHYTVEIRHLHLETGHIPQDIRITTADGNVDDRLVTTFAETDGFWLPSRQLRTLRRDDTEETMTVEFIDYRVNIKLPPGVRFGEGPQAE
ncbi:MAG: hypothetical protein GWO11_01295 [Desulfuromonadales bacterium]|nr:hypothetical protein [Desulfuromonadales bacterium]NIR33137.1 hypothetical protein [Desulfuromonadales bacterium]NIS43139.1 hypothetical protein [Desulfuromonadales bacterium]